MLKLAVLLQTVQAWQVYGVSVAEGFLALAGQYGRFGCFELKMGKTLPFSPSVADSAVLGWASCISFCQQIITFLSMNDQ